MKKIALLGSTGYIGRKALDIISNFRDRFEVVSLCAGKNIELLKKQIKTFRPKLVSVISPELAKELKKIFPKEPKVLFGEDGIKEAVFSPEVNFVLCAISGSAGLMPTVFAIEAKKRLAIANKESIVMAGKLIMKMAKENGIDVLPVDSEHSAIFQCLLGHSKKEVKNLILTASGGPFFGKKREELKHVTPGQALSHPRWEMGKKITIDSATLMNKGLEVIEACIFFNMPPDKIKVYIHPESVVHSMVEYSDGSMLAFISAVDMRIPIAYALSYPERLCMESLSLDLTSFSGLRFYKPDMKTFPSLKIAYDVAKEGGSFPCVMSVANEVAVSYFLKGKLGFLDIPNVVERVLEEHVGFEPKTIQEIVYLERWTREKTKNLIEGWFKKDV